MFEFTDDYRIGIPELDKEHEALVHLINETGELLEEDEIDIYILAKNLQRKLSSYIKTHLKHEEAYMELHNDPELPRQKKEHATFIKHVLEIPLDDSIKVRDLEDIMKFLVRWLFHHILCSDMMIGQNTSTNQTKKDPFAFTKQYETGITLIDEEHKNLFDIIREANNLIHDDLLHDKFDKIMEILDRLQNYTREHFSDEEEYMKKIGYPKLAEQKKAHEAFIDQLVDIDLNQLDDIDDNQQEYLIKLIDFLLNWLSNHILKSDKLIGEYVINQSQVDK